MPEILSDKMTIAVLPFVNMSGSGELEYFSDGITEEIINALARIPRLKVTSRTSSFYFKDRKLPVKQIADQLGVNALLEGSVRLSSGTIRITAQLIHAEEDFHFWSETWDRKLENIFEIQDEISLHIADRLREQYGHLEIQDHLVGHKSSSIEAYDLYLQARYHFNKWNPADVQTAIGLYEKAVALDPGNTDSFVGLADAFSFFAVTELMPVKEAWKKTMENIHIARELDPDNAGVHYQLANLSFFHEADFREAFRHARRSIELNPNYPEARQFMTLLYTISGDLARAKQELDILIDIDPLSQESLFYRAYFLYRSADYRGALLHYDECLDKNPMNIPAYISRSYCLLKLGRYDEAIEFLEQMPKEILVSDDRTGTLCLTRIMKDGREQATECLSALEEKSKDPLAFQSHSYLYLALAICGENDMTFDWLDKAMKMKSSVLLLSFSDPLAEELRKDPRYPDYHKKFYGLPGGKLLVGKEKTSLLDPGTAGQYREKLLKYIEEEEPFLVPNLSLRGLAEMVDIHPNKLSWLLNEEIGKNFNEFINQYRIAYFKKLAVDPANHRMSLIGLAYESGFNSKTVFNTYFRKETGKTPKEFLNNPS